MNVNRYIVFSKAGVVDLAEEPAPEPGPGEVLIRTARSLISTGTELMLLGGAASVGSTWADLASFPFRPGYSNVGAVVAVSDGVDRSWLGRRVGSHTPHAAYVTCSAADLRPIPDSVSDEDAAFGTLSEVVMNGLRRGRLSWGESVGVAGVGVLGHLCVRLCAVAGAHPVFAFDISEERLSRVPKGAPFHALRGRAQDVRDRVIDLNRGRKLDVVFELTGNPEAIPAELSLLRSQGRFVVLSSPRGATLFDFHDLCNRESFTIIGAHGFSHPPVETPASPWSGKRHGELFLEYVATGRLTVGDLISHRFSVEQARDAYDLLATRREQSLGVILKWDA